MEDSTNQPLTILVYAHFGLTLITRQRYTSSSPIAPTGRIHRIDEIQDSLWRCLFELGF
jgi:hypothetical protein